MASYKGNAFLGIDAGSTTTKIALVGENGELLYSFYYDIEDTDNADFNDDGIVNILDLIGIKNL